MKKLLFSFLILSFFTPRVFAETVKFRAHLGITKVIETQSEVLWQLPDKTALIQTIPLTEHEENTWVGRWMEEIMEEGVLFRAIVDVWRFDRKDQPPLYRVRGTIQTPDAKNIAQEQSIPEKLSLMSDMAFDGSPYIFEKDSHEKITLIPTLWIRSEYANPWP